MNAEIDILIIDDDEDMSYTLSRMVEQAGYRSRAAFSIGEGIEAAGEGSYDLVFLDVNLPDGSGLDIIPDLKRFDKAPEIIIFTAYGDPEGAAVALGNNVWDYIAKPARMDDIRLTMMRALDYRRQKLQKKPVSVDRSSIIGNSPQMAACIETLIIAANSSANVLITGETGTGKELFAKAVHSNSNRAGKPFVIVDCAALPDTLVESILFGHVRGAFTGAERDTRGLVGQADGGTLFLDELGELPPELQKVFLRVIQEHSYRPVGANHQESSDFRLIAATNRDLDSMVEAGRFRKDLLHRTRTLELRLPPLRERKRDIRDLVHFQLARICDQYGIGTKGLAPEVVETLSGHDWPGNVRELFNTIEMAFSTAFHEQTIFHYHLPTQLRVKVKARALLSAAPSRKQPLPPPPAAAGEFPTMEEVVDSARVDYLRKLLAATAGNITEACRRSGLSRTTLYNHLSRYGLTPGKNKSNRLQGGGS